MTVAPTKLMAFACGVGGVAFALLAWHVWIDHLMIHQVVAWVNANTAQAAAEAAKP